MCAISVVSFNAVSIPVREPRCRNIVNVGPNEQHGVDVAVQRVALQLPPRRAASERAKIPTISRAEGGQLQARVSWQLDACSSSRAGRWRFPIMVMLCRGGHTPKFG